MAVVQKLTLLLWKHEISLLQIVVSKYHLISLDEFTPEDPRLLCKLQSASAAMRFHSGHQSA